METSSLNFNDDRDPITIGIAQLGSSQPGLLPFAYSELPAGHIRLLTINPLTVGRRTPRFTVRAIRWDSNVAYEALSYVWGKPIFDREIELNSASFKITGDLYTALRNLGHIFSSRTLWIDAICINQSDDNEKSTQVGLMAEIYKRATRVLVWLGLEDAAINHLKKLNHMFRRMDDSGKAWTEARQRKLARRVGEKIFGTHHESYESDLEFLERSAQNKNFVSIVRFFGNPWWSRMWIVQEVVLAGSVLFVCRRHTISMEAVQGSRKPLFWLLEWVHAIGTEAEFDFDSALQTSEQVLSLLQTATPRTNLSNRPLLYTLDRLNYNSQFETGEKRQCTDSRDRIFAVLSLASDNLVEHNQPDYSLGSTEVFVRFVRTSVQIKRSLDVLHCCPDDWFSPEKDVEDLELTYRDERSTISWIPHWDRHHHNSLIAASFISEIPIYSAGGSNIRNEPFEFSTPSIVSPHGFVLDVVSKMSIRKCLTNNLDKNSDPTDIIVNQIEVWYQMLEDSSVNLNGIAFWRTMTADLNDLRLRADSSWKTRLEEYVRGLSLEELPWLALKHKGKYKQLLRCCVSRKGLKFCITEQGRLAMVPPYTKAGDLICVLFGGQMPFVLRFFSEINLCRLVGECYVDGVMDGEALREHDEEGKYERRTFRIY